MVQPFLTIAKKLQELRYQSFNCWRATGVTDNSPKEISPNGQFGEKNSDNMNSPVICTHLYSCCLYVAMIYCFRIKRASCIYHATIFVHSTILFSLCSTRRDPSLPDRGLHATAFSTQLEILKVGYFKYHRVGHLFN